MPKSIQTPQSALLSFMSSYNINQPTLAKAVGISYPAIRLIVLGKVRISVSTALRFSKYFGNTPAFWLDLQQQADIKEAAKDKKLQKDLKGIKKAIKAAKKETSVKRGRPAKKVSRVKSVLSRKKRSVSKTRKLR